MTAAPEIERVTISDQIAEVRRELMARRTRYAAQVDGGTMTAEAASMYNRRMMAVLATLHTIERHADGLRLLIGALLTGPKDLDTLRNHPAVREVLAAFPDGVLKDSP